MRKETLLALAADLRAGRAVELSTEDFPCFSKEAAEADKRTSPEALARISAALTADDACVFERAARAIDEGDLAWIGFKVVDDAAAAVSNVDNEVTKKYGDVGSADGRDLVFFCNDAKEAVAARAYSTWRLRPPRLPAMWDFRWKWSTTTRRFSTKSASPTSSAR